MAVTAAMLISGQAAGTAEEVARAVRAAGPRD